LAGRHSLSYLSRHFKPSSGQQKKVPRFVLRYGHFLGRDGAVIDEVMAVYMPEGKSYTGKDQVEIYCHGGRQVVKLIQDELINSGARVAEPGEFTRMAFLAGRIDLTKAEAVAEIIEANTDTSYSAARDHLLGSYQAYVGQIREALIDIVAEVEASVDYPEEDIDPKQKSGLVASLDVIMSDIKELVETYRGGRIINEGFKVAIGGRPNAGKSSLFNLLLRQERALVTPTPGTTRDYLSEWIELDGYKVNLTDTAGLRQTGGTVEKAGQKSARQVLKGANLIIWMIDVSRKTWKAQLDQDLKELPGIPMLLIGNKLDLVGKTGKESTKLNGGDILGLSCKTGKGIPALKKAITDNISDKMPDLTSGAVVTSARHRQKLSASLGSLKSARLKLNRDESPELTAFDLRQAVAAIDEITGKIYTEEILGRIFSKFCIGK
jgi:tRNA modification GTPase